MRIETITSGWLALTLAACAATGAEPSGQEGDQASAAAMSAVVPAVDGSTYRMEDALGAGRTVALVFWQPWCGSCKAEAPHASSAAARFADTMDVVGVVSGPTGAVDESLVKEAIFDWGITYPTLRDRDLTLTRAFEVSATPMIVIVEPGGSVVYRSETPPAEWLD
jgi:thiol-disulfide isomerase/thioredoxin